ncbi:MAG: glycosyltransferase family 1 protein [Dehalococcoidia bacterium]
MKIALDLSWLPPRRAGAGRYGWELANALARLETDDTFTVYAPAGTFAGSAVASNPRFRVVATPKARAARLLWGQTVLPLILRSDRPDVLHIGHSQAPLVPTGVPTVVTFHDATYELSPQRYPLLRRSYYRLAARIAARQARLVVAVSRCVAGDIERHLSISSRRVRVIPEAAAEHFRRPDDASICAVRQRYGLSRPYVLSVGSLEPGKGRDILARAMKDLEGEVDLVIAGQPAWGEIPLPGGRYLGFVPDDDLPALYAGAEVFAFPSLYEGFGLPVLEAMACGTPVVASDTSATPEVAGGAALLVPPGDAGALATGLRSVLGDPVLRATMVEQGYRQAARFSWAETARRTLEVYREAAGR